MAADKIYPAGDLDVPFSFMRTMGSYWSRDFHDKDVLTAIIGARLRLFEQARIDALETEATYSRFTAPIYHTEQIVPLYFNRSNGVVVAAAPAVYGPSKALYGLPAANPPYDQVIEYGMNLFEGTSRALPLQPGIKSIGMLTNRITAPSIVLMEGIDFFIDQEAGLILLNEDILDNPDIARMVADEAKTEKLLLWAYNVEYDKDYIWNHAGYVVGVRDASSARYRDMVNAIWNSHVAAPSNATVMQLLSAVTDTPTVLSDGEVVELILDGPSKQVVTDKAVYTVSNKADIIVSVGDILTKWQQLTDTIEMYPLYNVTDGLSLYSTSTTNTPVDLQATVTNPATNLPVVYPEVSAYFSPSRRFTRPMEFYTSLVFNDKRPVPDCRTLGEIVSGQISYGSNLRYESFNGYFQNEDVLLTRNGLDDHDFITLEFKLLIVGDWRGNSNDSHFSLTIDGTKHIDTTFSNIKASPQAYPGATGASNYAWTGASRSALLNYQSTNGNGTPPYYLKGNRWMNWEDPDVDGYAEYTISVTVPHTAKSLSATYSVTGLPEDTWCVVVPTQFGGVHGYTLRWDAISSGTDEICLYRYVEGTPGSPGGWVLNETYIEPITATPPFRGKFTTDEFIDTYGVEPTLYNLSVIDWHAPAELRENLAYPSAFWGIQEPKLTLIKVNERKPISIPQSQVAQIVDVPGVTLDSHLLRGVYFEGLFFENKEVPLEYLGPDDLYGRVEVRFKISGYPGDVEQYWDDLHARGAKQGLTLANYLDQRPNPSGDPAQHNLPATVNPLLLVLRHVLGYNLFVIKLKSGNEGPSALESRYLGLLRDVTPPHSAYIIFTELVVDPEEMLEPRYAEVAVGQGPALTEIADIVLTERAPSIQGVPAV